MNDHVFRNVHFLSGTIHAGFPSPTSDYSERGLAIHDLVMPHPTSSFSCGAASSTPDHDCCAATAFSSSVRTSGASISLASMILI
jgi:hypothetical protein